MTRGSLGTGAVVAGLAGILCLVGLCPAEDPPKPTPDSQRDSNLPPPRKVAPPGPGPYNPPCLDRSAIGLTLVDTLRLALLTNLNIAQARTIVRQTLALRQRALAQWLPNVTFGATYTDHQGAIQNTAGSIINVNRDSLFVGGGPTITLGLTDALFGPGIARLVLQASVAGQRRVTNENLQLVADDYFNILRGFRRAYRIDQTLLYLTSDKRLPLAANSKGLLPVIRAFVQFGRELPSELSRVEVEIVRRREEEATILQDLRIAMAELARRLQLDPQLVMWPLEDFRWAIPIPGDPLLDCDVEDLVVLALQNRPDLAENRLLADAALRRLRLAKARPFLPNLATTYLAGDFGGGPNPENFMGQTFTGRTGRIEHFRHRQDWDASLFWRLNNLGFGNLAEIREQRALADRADLAALATANRVVTQVFQAVQAVEFTAERVKILQAGLFDARGRLGGPVYLNIERNFRRINAGGGRPLEVLDSIRSLSDVLDAYAIALTEYERARFRLLVALGMPSQGIVDPRLLPLPPCCNKAGKQPITPRPEPKPAAAAAVRISIKPIRGPGR